MEKQYEGTSAPNEKEVEKLKQRMLEHMQAELPFLRLQAEYEKLRAEVSEATFKRIKYNVELARMQDFQKKAEAESGEKEKEGV